MRGLLRPALLALLAVAAVGLAPRPAPAAPMVTVRARTDLQLKAVRREPDGRVSVIGLLLDHASGTGVGGQEVEVQIAGRSARRLTSPDGRFQIEVDAPPGRVDVSLRYEGDGRFDPASAVETDLDPSKMPVDLALDTVAAPEGALVTVTATADGYAVELPISLRINAADASEPHRDLDATTGKAVLVRRTDAFGPGRKRIQARFEGDPGRAAATVEQSVDLVSATRIDLHLGSSEVAFEDTIRARGQVLDEDGRPVAGAAVVLVSIDRRLGAATTGDDGHWSIGVAAELLGTGRHSLQAKVESRVAWLQPSTSTPPAFVTIGAPRPAPIGITIAAFAATAVVALGFVLARRRPARAAIPPAPAAPAAALVDPRGGLEPARASLVSTLRRASDHGFAGRVRDAVRGRPLAEAQVLLTLDGQVRSTASEPDGGFALEALSAGEWAARVSAPGHVSERFVVTIPHRGELRGARVDLVPVRERVFVLYRQAALPLLPSPDLWGIWSPRQIVDHVRAGSPPEALADLTAFVEETYFSARIADEAILPTAEAKVAAALTERARR